MPLTATALVESRTKKCTIQTIALFGYWMSAVESVKCLSYPFVISGSLLVLLGIFVSPSGCKECLSTRHSPKSRKAKYFFIRYDFPLSKALALKTG